MNNHKKTVGVFRAGHIDADLKHICRLLNRGEHFYSFEDATPLNLGDPDLHRYGYSDLAFHEILQPYFTSYDLCLVLTTVPIEDNFFTRDINCRIIVCTSHQADEFIKTSGRTYEEYFALSACPELVSVEFQRSTGRSWTELFHKNLEGCLFDFQGVKSQVAAYLGKMYMCESSRSLLSDANVDRRVVMFADTLLAKIRRPSFKKALRISIMSPILGFIYGGIVFGFLVNVLSSIALETTMPGWKENAILLVLFAGVVLFPIVVYISLWIKYIKGTRLIPV